MTMWPGTQVDRHRPPRDLDTRFCTSASQFSRAENICHQSLKRGLAMRLHNCIRCCRNFIDLEACSPARSTFAWARVSLLGWASGSHENWEFRLATGALRCAYPSTAAKLHSIGIARLTTAPHSPQPLRRQAAIHQVTGSSRRAGFAFSWLFSSSTEAGSGGPSEAGYGVFQFPSGFCLAR